MKVSTKHITHLLDLIDDPNNEIVEHVCTQLIAQGETIIPELEHRLHYTSFDHTEIERIHSIIQEIRFRSTLNSLKSWKKSNDKHLLEGIYLLSKFQFPELIQADLENAIEYYKNEIWLEINPKQTSFEIIKTFNEMFFNHFKFKVTAPKKSTPFDFFLPTVFQHQAGSEISIGIIYSLVAHELNIPIHGIVYPFNRFLLAYLDSNNILSLLGLPTENNGVLCYIDVTKKGGVLKQQQLELDLNAHLIEAKPAYFEPSSNTKVLKKYIELLYRSHLKTPSMNHKANYYKSFLDLF